MNPLPSSRISVWLIEDHADFRLMLSRVINRIEGISCPQAFSNCEAALRALKTQPPPQVILSDLGLPGISGVEGIKQIKTLSPSTHVIVLTVYDDHEKQGGAPMNSCVARKVLDMFASMAPQPKRDYGLSQREKEILTLMSKGLMKKEIADRLALSYHTVSNHLRAIYEKLRVHTHGGAVAKAISEQLL